MDTDAATATRTPTQLVAVGSGAVMVLGSLLPWATVRSGFGQVDFNGIEGDGFITLIFGCFIAGLAWSRIDRSGGQAAICITAALAGLLTIYTVSNIGTVTGSQYANVSPGVGLYLVGLAAVGAFVATLMDGSKRSQVHEK